MDNTASIESILQDLDIVALLLTKAQLKLGNAVISADILKHRELNHLISIIEDINRLDAKITSVQKHVANKRCPRCNGPVEFPNSISVLYSFSDNYCPDDFHGDHKGTYPGEKKNG